MAIFLMWICGALGKRKIKDFLFITIIPFIIAGIWYLIISPYFQEPAVAMQADNIEKTFLHIPLHLLFMFEDNNIFSAPWYYYISILPIYMGKTGTILAIIGAGLILRASFLNKKTPIPPTINHHITLKLWPLFLLIPAITLLSLGNAKVIWIMTVMLPAWATLQGITIIIFANKCYQFATTNNVIWKKMTGITGLITITIIFISLQYGAYKQNYEQLLEKVVPNQWRGAVYSMEVANKLNSLIVKDERILMTSFHYWRGLKAGRSCPIFNYYFTGDNKIIVRPYQDSFLSITNNIIQRQANWTVLSPPIGKMEHELFDGFDKILNLHPIQLKRAFIYNTTSLWDIKPETSSTKFP